MVEYRQHFTCISIMPLTAFFLLMFFSRKLHGADVINITKAINLPNYVWLWSTLYKHISHEIKKKNKKINLKGKITCVPNSFRNECNIYADTHKHTQQAICLINLPIWIRNQTKIVFIPRIWKMTKFHEFSGRNVHFDFFSSYN